MKVKADDLFTVVRQVVREELQKLLPQMISEHLTESYLKKIVLESASRKTARTEAFSLKNDADEEQVPKPMKNKDLGIYNDVNPINSKKNENVQKLLSRNNPLSFVYEGVDVAEKAATPQVPTDSFDFEKMNNMLDRMSSRGPMTVADPERQLEQKMRELEERRKQLEIPAKK